MAPQEAKAIIKLANKQTLCKLYKVDNFILIKDFMQK